MNWLDLFDDGGIGDRARFQEQEREDRHGPCEDDIEVVAPWIGMCPDESDHENGSPLNFGKPHVDHQGSLVSAREDERAFQLALRLGF